jgi:SAM-dependent methyltransferase
VNTYRSLHARHYDLIYAGKPYADEAAFVDGLLGRPRGALLDLACGTGRHAIELTRLGWTVTGVDYGADLLERAHTNAEAAGIDLRLYEQDMRTLDLGGERFDAVTCLFDSIGYPQTDEGVVAALRGGRDHLVPGGVLAVEFLHAGGGELLRVSRTKLDLERSVMHVAYDLLELAAEGTYERAREAQANRYFTVSEMRGLLRAAGLAERDFVAAYTADPAIDADTWHVLALASAA